MHRTSRLSFAVLLSALSVGGGCGGSDGKGSGGGSNTGGECTGVGPCDGGGLTAGELDGGGSGGGSGNGSGASNGASNGNVCAEVELDATPKTPNVVLIIDQSGSMTATFGASNRWDALRDSLLANDGLIKRLENSVRFGLALYTGDSDTKVCPLVTEVSVKLGNFSAIAAAYNDADPFDDTPTGESVDAVVKSVQDAKLLEGDDPTVFVLATDGEPDTCDQPDSNGEEPPRVVSVDAVERAYGLGIRTYVIAVSEEDEGSITQDHLQALSNAGAGVGAGDPDEPTYRVTDEVGLATTLSQIVAGELSCTVPLKGKVTADDPCVGTVKLGTTTLRCNDANGWKLVTPSSIEVQGTACAKLKQGAKLAATFPCDAAVIDVR